MKADHDMRDDFHRGRRQRGERRFEVGDRAVEMIDVADRLLRPYHVSHGHIDTGRFHVFGAPFVEQGRMCGNAQIGKLVLEFLDGRVIALVRHFVAPIGTAREEEAA